ncbi:MAG TPA: hypothetical protein PKA64_24675, partial [Myxococcota bacterium]|nr:hypothetical protein [Myxococcota bacterium]
MMRTMTAWWIAGALLFGACSGGATVESKVDGAQPGEAAAAIGDPAQAVDAPAAGEAAAAPVADAT